MFKVGVLTKSDNPNNYWKALKHRKRKLQIEGSELSEKIGQLKMKSEEHPKGLTENMNVAKGARDLLNK